MQQEDPAQPPSKKKKKLFLKNKSVSYNTLAELPQWCLGDVTYTKAKKLGFWERQIIYNIIYVGNLKQTDSEKYRVEWWLPEDGGVEGEGERSWSRGTNF